MLKFFAIRVPSTRVETLRSSWNRRRPWRFGSRSGHRSLTRGRCTLALLIAWKDMCFNSLAQRFTKFTGSIKEFLAGIVT